MLKCKIRGIYIFLSLIYNKEHVHSSFHLKTFVEFLVLFIILIPLLDLFIKIIFILCTYIHTHAYINTHTHMHTYIQTTHTYMT